MELPVWLDCLASKFKDPPVFTFLSGLESWELAAMPGLHLASGDPRSWPYACTFSYLTNPQLKRYFHFVCMDVFMRVHVCVCVSMHMCAHVCMHVLCIVCTHVCLVFTSVIPE